MNITITELSTDELETIQAGRGGSTHIGYMPSPIHWGDPSEQISIDKDLSMQSALQRGKGIWSNKNEKHAGMLVRLRDVLR